MTDVAAAGMRSAWQVALEQYDRAADKLNLSSAVRDVLHELFGDRFEGHLRMGSQCVLLVLCAAGSVSHLMNDLFVRVGPPLCDVADDFELGGEMWARGLGNFNLELRG